MRQLLTILFILSTTPVQAGGYCRTCYPAQKPGYVRTGFNTITNSPFNPQTYNTHLTFNYLIQNPGPTAQVGQTLTYSAFTEPVAYRIQAQLDAASRTVEQLPATLKETLGITLQTAKDVNVFQEARLKRESQTSTVERLFRLTQEAESLGQSIGVSVQANGVDETQETPATRQDAASEIVQLTSQHCGKCHGTGGNAINAFNMTQLGSLTAQQWQYVGISITGGGEADDGRIIPAMPKDDFHTLKYADKVRLLDLIRGK